MFYEDSIDLFFVLLVSQFLRQQ